MTIDADFGAGGAAEEKCLCTGLSGSLWVSFGSGLSGSGVSPGLSGSRLGRSDRFELFLLLFSQFFLFIFFFFYCCRAAHVAGVAPLRKSARSCADSGCCCRLPREGVDYLTNLFCHTHALSWPPGPGGRRIGEIRRKMKSTPGINGSALTVVVCRCNTFVTKQVAATECKC